jgi:hypothetical protein
MITKTHNKLFAQRSDRFFRRMLDHIVFISAGHSGSVDRDMLNKCRKQSARTVKQDGAGTIHDCPSTSVNDAVREVGYMLKHLNEKSTWQRTGKTAGRSKE